MGKLINQVLKYQKLKLRKHFGYGLIKKYLDQFHKNKRKEGRKGKEGIKNLDTDYINVPDMVCIFFLAGFFRHDT
jgi:hypothetical protein